MELARAGLIGGEGWWEDVYTGCQCRQDALVTTSAKERGRCSEGKSITLTENGILLKCGGMHDIFTK